VISLQSEYIVSIQHKNGSFASAASCERWLIEKGNFTSRGLFPQQLELTILSGLPPTSLRSLQMKSPHSLI